MPQEADDNALLDLQDQVAAELSRKPAFAGVAVLTTRKGTSESEIEKAAERYKGAFVTVSTMEARVNTPNVQGPRLTLPVIVTIIELPKLNRSSKGTNKPAELLALAAMRGLHHYCPPICAQLLQFEEMGPVEDDSALILALRFTTKINLSSQAHLAESP